MGVCEQLPTPSIAMEYMPKGNMYNAIRNDPITDAMLWKMIVDICTGMNYLHHRGCIHLDLKPLNLLVVRVSVACCDIRDALHLLICMSVAG